MDDFLIKEDLEHYLGIINKFRQNNSIPKVFKSYGNRPLSYEVIDGDKIKEHLPELLGLYHRVQEIVGLDLLSDEKVGINVNITKEGGAYRWHYDRNKVTAILYLNDVCGGETECYPGYRILLRCSILQRWLDRILFWVRGIFGNFSSISPKAGRLIIMEGNVCLHSVKPVESGERINIIMAYDEPNKDYVIQDNLNSYLYSSEAYKGDPNYR